MTAALIQWLLELNELWTRWRPFIFAGVLALSLASCSQVERREPMPASPAAAGAGESYSPGDYVAEITSGGQPRQYRLHVPPGYRPGSPTPLIVNLHGFTSNAAEQERLSGTSAKADEAGFIVVYPEALGEPQTWHVGPGTPGAGDVEFIHGLIGHLQGRLSVDPARIYVTGISNGGGMANRLACELSAVVAAIAPVSGAYLFSEDCRPSRPVPVVAFHGTADHIVPYEGNERSLPHIREWAAGWAARNGCAPTPAVTFRRGEVTGETWSGCRESAEVVLYTIEGRGHSWPGADLAPNLDVATKDINATDVIWDFFAAHPPGK
jgi:polyhydroxybutyrate depolymerase